MNCEVIRGWFRFLVVLPFHHCVLFCVNYFVFLFAFPPVNLRRKLSSLYWLYEKFYTNAIHLVDPFRSVMLTFSRGPVEAKYLDTYGDLREVPNSNEGCQKTRVSMTMISIPCTAFQFAHAFNQLQHTSLLHHIPSQSHDKYVQSQRQAPKAILAYVCL